MNRSAAGQAGISVIICAYDEERWDCLLRAIDSVAQQTVPAHEIIVVIDHNPKLLERVREAVPEVIAVENRQARGLSGGRNTGVAVASGNILAFLDDDADATQDWLEQLTHWFESDSVAGVGGTVAPRWEGEKPHWFPREFGWVIGCSYRGLPETSSAVRNLFGGCMCVRREVFELVGGFRNSIGRSEGRPMGCEETELCIRVHQRKPEWRFIYEPRALAYHRVPANRTTWAYFKARCYAEGLSKAQVSQLVGANDGLSSERSYALKTLPSGVGQGLVDAVTRGDPDGIFRALAIVAGLAYTALGYVVGIVSQTLAPRKSSMVQA